MKRFIYILLILFSCSFTFSQGYDKDRGRDVEAEDEKPKVEFNLGRIALGVGSFFDTEAITFSTDALYFSVQWHGFEFPILKEGTSTGIMIEGHVAKLFTEDFEDGDVRFQYLEHLDYRIWSCNRVPINAIPIEKLQSGSISRMYAGTDLLIAEGGPDDFTGDFDARFVFGGDLGVIGPGNLVVEIYSFQQDIPIAFGIFYGF